jgi:hypothetical protein
MLSNLYNERTTAHMAYYGIDPTDWKYQRVRAQTAGWCSFCAQHSVDNPRPLCDLEKARAAEMEELGFPARSCAHCRKAHPEMLSKAMLCPACQIAQAKKDAEALRRVKGCATTSRLDGASVRVDDGLGCTERLPRWTVDWDGNPNA